MRVAPVVGIGRLAFADIKSHSGGFLLGHQILILLVEVFDGIALKVKDQELAKEFAKALEGRSDAFTFTPYEKHLDIEGPSRALANSFANS